MSSLLKPRLSSGKRLVSLDFWVRIIGMFGLGYAGWWFGNRVSSKPASPDEVRATLLLALSGAGLGLIITHRIILEPIRDINRWLRDTSASDLIALAIGGLFGALFGVLLVFPLSYLPGVLGNYLPIIIAGLAVYISALAVLGHKNELMTWSRNLVPSKRRSRGDVPTFGRACLLDTSAIIDGRISAVVRSGFLDSVLIVPRFVLNELQLLADSSDDMKRMRGRRGLDLLNDMQKDPAITIEIISDDVSGVRGVDQKLIALAIQQSRSLITNDKNMSQVAELQDIQVLNLNVLSDAVRPPAIAGDMMVVNIREEGREREQGIGYLDDGTMVVVEDARDRLGEDVRVVVSRVWANDRGRMVFGRIMGSAGTHS